MKAKKVLFCILILCMLIITCYSAFADENKTNHGKLKAKHIYAEAEFLEDVNVYDKNKNSVLGKIKIEKNKVSITDNELKGHKAKITFLLTSFKNPIVFKNNKWAKDIKPTREGLSSWSFNVPHFSSYTIEENTWAGTHENTTIYSEAGLELGLDSLAVGIYEFSENATGNITEDISSSENNGTLSDLYHSKVNDDGFSAWDTDNCKVGNCLRFDKGEDYIIVNNVGSRFDFGTDEDFSISFWMKIDTSNVNHRIFSTTDISTGFFTDINADKLRFFTKAGATYGASLTSALADVTVWNHVVYVIDKTGANKTFIYLNGVNQSVTYTNPQNINDNTNAPTNLKIGRILTQSPNLEGALDEVKIYNVSLTQSQVDDIYGNESVGLNSERLASNVLDLSFNESSGTSATDSSGNNGDGTIYGHNRPFWNATGGHDGLGAYEFDGVGYIEIESDNSLYYNISKNYTISTWFKYNNSISDTIYQTNTNGLRFDVSGGATANLRIKKNSGGFESTDSSTCISSDIWQHGTWVLEQDGTSGNVSFYCNGVFDKKSALSGFPFDDSSSINTLGGSYTIWEGLIDDFLIIPITLNSDQIQEIYTNGSNYKYYDEGSYTSIVYNATDYDPLAQINLFTNTVYDNIGNVSSSNGKAGDCLLINGVSWTSGTLSGNSYTYGKQVGTCFMYQLDLIGSGREKTNYASVNVTAYKVLVPEVTDLTIEQIGNPSDPILGNCTFMLNNTDTGYVDIEWFNNNVSITTDSVAGLINDTVGEFTLSSGFVKDDLIKFSCIPKLAYAYGEVWGTEVNSSEFTVNNSNFTYITYPSESNLTIIKPNAPKFKVVLVDLDSDVVVTWKIDGETKLVDSTTYNFPSIELIESFPYTLTAEMSDGVINQTATWTITVNDQNLTLPMVIGLLGVALLFFFFAFKLEADHFILKIFLILIGLITLILIPSAFTTGYAGVKDNFLDITLWMFYIFIAYLLVYLFYHWAKGSYIFVKWLGKRKE